MERSIRRKWIALAMSLAALSGCTNPDVDSAEDPLGADWDIVVVGGGLMGSSTAWQLARAGQRVLLLEKQAAVYSQGSSFGDARIARSLGPPGDMWSYMHNRTVSEAEQLIAFLRDHGDDAAMTDIYSTSPVNYVRNEGRLEGYAYLPDQPDEYEIATTPEEGVARFGLAIPSDVFVVREYKEHSGTINPSALIGLLHRAIGLAGGHVEYGREVTELGRTDTGYELLIRTDGEEAGHRLVAPKVVSAAGPYTGPLLSEIAPEFDELISPERVFLAFYEIAPDFWEGLSTEQQGRLRDLFPAINSTVATRDGTNFSMIERDTERGTPILKIGGHFQRSEIEDLDAVWAQELSAEELEWASSSLLRHLSLLDLELTSDHLLLDSGYSCVYSLTATEVPYVTHALRPDESVDPNLVIVAGLSGVGAKGALAYGVIAADLVLDRTEASAEYVAARAAFGLERYRNDRTSLLQSPGAQAVGSGAR
ncbi:MAG: FAD-dependent oxidoreductase [Acidobacteria bacterium]|nr:FAD-dependent oxidoreductase [Acidobacteriota bacterium]